MISTKKSRVLAERKLPFFALIGMLVLGLGLAVYATYQQTGLRTKAAGADVEFALIGDSVEGNTNEGKQVLDIKQGVTDAGAYIVIKPNGEEITAVELKVVYDPSKIEIVNEGSTPGRVNPDKFKLKTLIIPQAAGELRLLGFTDPDPANRTVSKENFNLGNIRLKFKDGVPVDTKSKISISKSDSSYSAVGATGFRKFNNVAEFYANNYQQTEPGTVTVSIEPGTTDKTTLKVGDTVKYTAGESHGNWNTVIKAIYSQGQNSITSEEASRAFVCNSDGKSECTVTVGNDNVNKYLHFVVDLVTNNGTYTITCGWPTSRFTATPAGWSAPDNLVCDNRSFVLNKGILIGNAAAREKVSIGKGVVAAAAANRLKELPEGGKITYEAGTVPSGWQPSLKIVYSDSADSPTKEEAEFASKCNQSGQVCSDFETKLDGKEFRYVHFFTNIQKQIGDVIILCTWKSASESGTTNGFVTINQKQGGRINHADDKLVVPSNLECNNTSFDKSQALKIIKPAPKAEPEVIVTVPKGIISKSPNTNFVTPGVDVTYGNSAVSPSDWQTNLKVVYSADPNTPDVEAITTPKCNTSTSKSCTFKVADVAGKPYIHFITNAQKTVGSDIVLCGWNSANDPSQKSGFVTVPTGHPESIANNWRCQNSSFDKSQTLTVVTLDDE